jgi:hypothetical protein
LVAALIAFGALMGFGAALTAFGALMAFGAALMAFGAVTAFAAGTGKAAGECTFAAFACGGFASLVMTVADALTGSAAFALRDV